MGNYFSQGAEIIIRASYRRSVTSESAVSSREGENRLSGFLGHRNEAPVMPDGGEAVGVLVR